MVARLVCWGLCLLCAAVTPTFADDELLGNSGFEEGTTAAGLPAGGWYRNYGDARSQWAVQAGDAHSGEHCLRLDAPTLPQKDPAVTIEQEVPVTPGQSYVLRAWTKGRPAGVPGLLIIVWKGKDHGWLTTSGQEVKLTDTWTVHRVVGQAPPDAAYAVARFDIRQPGTAWLDDVSLRLRQAATIAADVQDGPVTAGQLYLVRLTALDADALPLPGTEITVSMATDGDARIVSQGGGDEEVTKAAFVSDERGETTLWVRASRQPGHADTLQITSGTASRTVQVRSARLGTPKRWHIEIGPRALRPHEEVEVAIQLRGGFGELLPLAGRKATVAVSGPGSVSPTSIVTDADGVAIVRLRAGAELFTPLRLTVQDALGLTGESGPLVVAPPERADAIRVRPRRWFGHPDDTTFVPLGGLYANFVCQVDHGTCGKILSTSIADVSDDQLRAWFAYLHDNGVNALRVMLRDHTKRGTEPMDAIGKVNLPLLRRWEHYMALARPYGIRFLVTLHESWYATYAAYHNRDCLERCVLPAYSAAELAALPSYRRRFLVEKRMLEQTTGAFTDPDVIACQRDYLIDLIPRLRANPDIFAYEIENEQPTGYRRWTYEQCALVRQLDHATPIGASHLGGALLSADPLPWSSGMPLDFYTYHTYPGGEATSKAMDYGTTVALTARYCRSGRPSFSGEAFGDEWYKATPEARRLGARDCLWSQLLGGAMGCFFWITGDEAIKQFGRAHSVLSRLDLSQVSRARPRVGIDVGHSPSADTFFQTAPGRAMYAALGRSVQACVRRGVDFDLTFEPHLYAVGLKPGDTAAIERLEPEVQVPEGCQVQYLRSADGRTFVAYLRNVAAVVPIQADPSAGYTRSRAPLPLTIQVRVPLATARLRVLDLDTGNERELPVSEARALDLGLTDHDFLVGTWGGAAPVKGR